jgi:septal ring factor EnvC (AmiA/AmiB activator)
VKLSLPVAISFFYNVTVPTHSVKRQAVKKRLALHKRRTQIRAEISTLKRDRASVKREEFDAMSKTLRQLEKNTNDLATQLTRIAQIQVEVDVIKRALVKAKLLN